MSPETKAILAAVAVAAAIGTVALIDPTSTDKQVALDEKTLPVKEQAEVRALRLPDAGLIYARVAIVDGGEVAIKVAQAPCAWRPKTAVLPCTRRDGGDPGSENTLQPGEWVGLGCVRKACVIYAGQPDDDALLPVVPVKVDVAEVPQ